MAKKNSNPCRKVSGMLRKFVAGLFCLAGALGAFAGGYSFGPGQYSAFGTENNGSAVVAGVSGVTIDAFSSNDSYGIRCFVDASIVDAEKTAADDDDDYWCGPITDMNMLYITGWARKTKYRTVDDMVDYFRANKTLLRYARTPGVIATVTEGKYGYDGILRWFKDTTKTDLAQFTKNSSESLTADMFETLMGKGECVLNIAVLFDMDNGNRKWNGYSVSHAVTCCGYETDSNGELCGLFIIDSDNDQYDGAGGRSAPNSIMRCRAYMDYNMGLYAIEGIWGTTSWLLPGYTALKMYPGETKNVKLDANGGKVAPSTIAVVEGKTYSELPVPTKAGGEFEGWWTAKEGGVQVQDGDYVDLSIFANPKAPTLYAQWRKANKITVSGGFVVSEPTATTTKSGLYRGDEVGVRIDGSKLYDKNGNMVNAFANWTYTPATADLGEGFDPLSPEVTVSMPNADVKLTANFVNGFAGYLYCSYYIEGTDVQGNEPEGDFYWSIDNGKTLFPFGESEYPVKSGKVTVKFYDKTGKWRAADQTFTFNKRGTYKEDGVTRYSDPEPFFPLAKFVPVDNSTKVKMDANGGMGSGDVFFANGCDYGWLGIPYRKGYVFAGWWTAKDGGEHITQDKMFDPADFVGQKTPTIYAHWLQFRKLTMKDDSAYAYWDLEDANFNPELLDEITQSLSMGSGFEGYGELEGKGVLEVLPGAKVMVNAADVSQDKNGNELAFQRWTVTPSKVDLGTNFKATWNGTDFIMPNEDVTLQAAYIDELKAGNLSCVLSYQTTHIGWDYINEEEVYLAPAAGSVEWSVDGGKNWYKATMYDMSSFNEDFYGDSPMLKPGKYTVTWRSTDPQWTVSATKDPVNVTAGEWHDVYAQGISFTPQVVVDIMAYDRESEGYIAAPAAGAVTLNPKDGLVPAGKTATLTAKAAKDYAFQGYLFRKYWDGTSYYFSRTAATWKLENSEYGGSGMCGSSSYLMGFIDPVDKKVHVAAAFKALADYSADDIEFYGFSGYNSANEVSYDGDGNASLTMKAVAGCALDEEDVIAIDCAPGSFPLSYKLNGKLPDGLKFDAKTGVLSGAPKRAGTATVTIVATDPAKNSKALTVNFEVAPLPSWLAGEYRGMMFEERYIDGYYEWDEESQQEVYVPGKDLPGPQNGILELSVKSDGKVSAKVITRLGIRSVSGTLVWRDPETYDGYDDDEGEFAEFRFWHTDKDDSYCHVKFHEDGTIDGYVDSYDKVNDGWEGGHMTGLRQAAEQIAISPILDKYYTFAFSAEADKDEDAMQSGYGYLTIKTDKKGSAKVTGQLPDGEKVSMSAMLLPIEPGLCCGMSPPSGAARLYLFASPSSYKKLGWFAMSLVVSPDGTVVSEENAAWMPGGGADHSDDCNDDIESGLEVSTLSGSGFWYSEAKTLEDYYWLAYCDYNDEVILEYSWKEPDFTATAYVEADSAEGNFFNVAVKGDNKGALSLVDKSQPASQFSISFAKATGIFTGKSSVSFDYWLPNYKKDKSGEYYDAGSEKHVTVALPYAGVMIYDGDGGYEGFGSAVYGFDHRHMNCDGKIETEKRKITLPVSLTPYYPQFGD